MMAGPETSITSRFVFEEASDPQDGSAPVKHARRNRGPGLSGAALFDDDAD